METPVLATCRTAVAGGKTPATPGNSPHCPVCGAPCHPLHGAWRCSRCRYSICEGCDDGGVQDGLETRPA